MLAFITLARLRLLKMAARLSNGVCDPDQWLRGRDQESVEGSLEPVFLDKFLPGRSRRWF